MKPKQPAAQPLGSAGRQRNYGIDLLRIVAMWLIVCQHIINRGGVSYARDRQLQLLYPLWVTVTAGVNLYALISGYVMVNGRFHPARVAELWLQVLVLDLFLSVTGSSIDPASMNEEMWVRSLFPLTQKPFWYFSAYVAAYAFTPLINRGILALNRRQTKAMFWLMLLLFSLGASMGYSYQGDPYAIAAGYSALWLLALYVVGACMRHGRLLEKTPWWVLLLSAAACIVLITLCRDLLYRKPLPEFWTNQRKQLLRYTNPLLTGFSVLTVALFARIRVGKAGAWVIRQLAPLTFGVYVLHVHHVVWIRIENAYRPLLKLSPEALPWAVLAAGLGLFLTCAAVDWLRAGLFRLLRVRKGLDALERRLLQYLEKEPRS